jgi:acetolactate synthase-1/2/3 large subunit
MVTGIATAMLDSSPIVCITGQVGSKLIGSDAFQETDITGVTLPITKHNYLVTRAEDVAPTIREAFHVAASGRPGPVLIDITKDAQQSSCEFDWEAAEVKLRGYRPDHRPAPADFQKAVALIREAKRPLILAGRGIIQSGATEQVIAFSEATQTPIAMTLLGLGGIPASHPMNLGMMGMHGEAWVNTAIQEADLLLAFGMRFDDRVTGNLKTYALNAKKIHIEIDPAEVNKNVHVDVALVGDLREVLTDLLPLAPKSEHPEWLGRITELKGDSAVRDIQNLPDNGHLYAAHVINDLWRETDGNAVVVTDVGQHQMWEAQYYKHNTPRSLITSGGLGTMGFALPAAIGDGRAGEPGHQRRHHQQRLSRHGAAVAGVLLREALRRHAAGEPELREAGRGVRPDGHHRHQAKRGRADRQGRAQPSRRRRDRLPGRAGRFGVPDGAGRRGSASDDSTAQPHRGDCR